MHNRFVRKAVTAVAFTSLVVAVGAATADAAHVQLRRLQPLARFPVHRPRPPSPRRSRLGPLASRARRQCSPGGSHERAQQPSPAAVGRRSGSAHRRSGQRRHRVRRPGRKARTCVGATGSVSGVTAPQYGTGRAHIELLTGFLSGAGPDGSFAVGSDGVNQRNAWSPIYVQETYAPPDVIPAPLPSVAVGQAPRRAAVRFRQ